MKMAELNTIAAEPVAPSSPMLVAEGLMRSFGPVRAVDDVSLVLHRGRITGFIGTNGAGKTTTLRMLATLDFPQAGSITVDGVDALAYPTEVRAQLGWMPDAFAAYDNLSVRHYLEFFGRAYGLRGPALRQRIEQVVEFVGLENLLERPSRNLSKGETQRMSLGRTLLQDPALLLLDEPAAGLDPRARVEFRRLVVALRDQGKTLLLSSHILADLEAICDDLIFIDGGRILHAGTPESIRAHTQVEVHVRVRLHSDVEAWRQWVELQPGVKGVELQAKGGLVDLADGSPEAISAHLRATVQAGHAVYDFQRIEARLEDAFMRLLEPAVNSPAEASTMPPPIPSAET